MWWQRYDIFGRLIVHAGILILTLSGISAAKKVQKKPSKDTSVFNFIRLFIFRMVYGFATMFGAQESISEFMDGIFVPPGADDGDYRDYLDGEDDYYY